MNVLRPRESLVLWIQGGLGNQLFQLSGATAVARDSGLPLLVSRSSFLRDPLRDFEAGAVLAPGQLLRWPEELLIGWPYSRSGELRSKSLVGNLEVRDVDRDGLAHLRAGSVLLGFFQQADHLLLPTAEVVASLKRVRPQRVPYSLGRLVEGRVVAHVRRGDYVSNQAAASRFGTLTLSYYWEAFQAMGVAPEDVIFFTDDVNFVHDEFKVPKEQIFGPDRGLSDLGTLLLMSMAGGVVIANSTFSWWAAEVADRTVDICAPETWFVDVEAGHTLARERWRKVPNG